MGKQKFLLTLAMTVLAFVVSNSQTASAQNANLSGNWNLEASIIVSSPPEFGCSFPTLIGDPVIPVTQSGSDLFTFDTDTGGQQFTLQGTVIGNLVDFTITGFGITPGTGGCSLAARNFSTQYSGEFDVDTQTVTGTVFGSAEYVFHFDENGDPIFTVVTWSGTFTVEILKEIDYFALGDSVASGHGLPGQSADDCKRAPGAYPQLVAGFLVVDPGSPFSSSTLHHFACSGAPSENLAAQVEMVLEDLSQKRQQQSTTALVSITIGANDFPWTNAPALGQFLCSPESDFRAAVTGLATNIEMNVRNGITRLLSARDIHIVVTDYHNPYNTVSRILALFVTRFLRFGGLLIPNPLFQQQCAELSVHGLYTRNERAVHALNRALAQAAASFPTDPVRFASVHKAFHGHESPKPICGKALPRVKDSWVQSPDDLNLLEPGDDCFHPNGVGAERFANTVFDVSRQLLNFRTP